MIGDFLSRCHDTTWFFLHIIILNIPPTRLFLFPALAASVWFATLASLLLTWIARGMPRYPGQSNPHVAFVATHFLFPFLSFFLSFFTLLFPHLLITKGPFPPFSSFISDIASFELKPLFLVGASITAVGFVSTVAAVHVVRYEPGFALVKGPRETLVDDRSDHEDSDDSHSEDEEDHETTRTLKLISLLAIFAAGVASTALILLAVMDTFRYKNVHHIFLRTCFAGLAVQSACTAVVYSNEVLGFVSYVYHMGIWQHDWGKRSLRVRVFASLSTALILVEVFLGVAFISMTMPDKNPSYRTGGILEWIIAFLGTIYLWLFCGFLDRTNFDGFVPSILYNPPKLPEDGPSLSTPQRHTPVSDPERAPLVESSAGRKYT